MQKTTETRTYDEDGNTTETSRVTTDDGGRDDGSAASVVARVISYIGGVLVVLLAIRFVLILLGANAANGFVNFIYSLTYPLAAPFFGIVGYRLQYGVSRVEAASLIAIVVYALVAFGIARLLTIRHE